VADGDQGRVLVEAVLDTRASGRPVAIAGSGSKSFLCTGRDGERGGRLLSTIEHSGVVDYRPDELVVTVRSGTPLKELKQILAREGQMLPFEPPEYRGLGTIGGAIASGLAGPGRPWRGSVRDALLGVVMVNGFGEALRFGGQVMKNVAGFDVSRLQAGAWGIFGLLLEVSVKVVPTPAMEQTLSFQVDASSALELMRRWARLPLPISATAFEADRLHVRLSGAQSSVIEAVERLGGDLDGELRSDDGYWTELRDHGRDFFKAGQLARRQCAPATPLEEADKLIEWSGARRWTLVEQGSLSEDFVPFGSGFAAAICRQAGGKALLAEYQRRLKAAFDPDNIFNPEICGADVPA